MSFGFNNSDNKHKQQFQNNILITEDVQTDLEFNQTQYTLNISQQLANQQLTPHDMRRRNNADIIVNFQKSSGSFRNQNFQSVTHKKNSKRYQNSKTGFQETFSAGPVKLPQMNARLLSPEAMAFNDSYNEKLQSRIQAKQNITRMRKNNHKTVNCNASMQGAVRQNKSQFDKLYMNSIDDIRRYKSPNIAIRDAKYENLGQQFTLESTCAIETNHRASKSTFSKRVPHSIQSKYENNGTQNNSVSSSPKGPGKHISFMTNPSLDQGLHSLQIQSFDNSLENDQNIYFFQPLDSINLMDSSREDDDIVITDRDNIQQHDQNKSKTIDFFDRDSDENPLYRDPVIQQIMQSGIGEFEQSVVPGQLRNKIVDQETEEWDPKKKYQSIIMDGMKDQILGIGSKGLQAGLKQKHKQQRYAKLKYKMIKSKLEEEKAFKRHQIWNHQKRYQRKLKNHVETFTHEYQQASIARKREIEQTFTQKCVVEKSKPGPNEHEKTIQLLGTSDVMPQKLRTMCKNILQKQLGVVKPQTQQDKNLKAFDKYQVTQEELDQRARERQEREIRAALRARELNQQREAGFGGDQSYKQNFFQKHKNQKKKGNDNGSNTNQFSNTQESQYNFEKVHLRQNKSPNRFVTVPDLIDQASPYRKGHSKKQLPPSLKPSSNWNNQKLNPILLNNTLAQYENTQETPQRQNELMFDVSPESHHRKGSLDLTKFGLKTILEKKSPRQILMENRQNFNAINQFGNNHYRTSQQTKQAINNGVLSKNSSRTATTISKFDRLSANLSSIGDIANKMNRFQKIKEEDKQILINIFTNIKDDPNWTEDSFLAELFNSRISIAEFLGLMASDREWSHMANKKQTEKIIQLFDKVYGYIEGLSRIDEMNKRYQKQKQKDKKKEATNSKTDQEHLSEVNKIDQKLKAKKEEKNILKELFGAGGQLDVNMVDRYSDFLNQILIGSQSKWFQEKHQTWLTQTTGATKALTFYERMQIDLMMRQKKEDEMELANKNESDGNESNGEEKDLLENMEQSEIEIYYKVKSMADSLGISYDKALEIHEMTSKKGIFSKTLGYHEQEELVLSPKLLEYAMKIKEFMQKQEPTREDFDEEVIYVPENDVDFSNLTDSEIEQLANQKTSKQFKLKSLKTVPGKFMIGELSDQEFEDWIIGHMDRYIEAKKAFGILRKGFSVKQSVPGFEHTTAQTQIDFKIRKRENDESRHGVDFVSKLDKEGLLLDRMNQSKVPQEFH